MQGLLQDIRFALQLLWKGRGFTCIAILTLALGIGCNTGVFSFIYAWVLTPAPFPQAAQLTLIRFEHRTEKSVENLAPADFADLREASGETFQSMAGFDIENFNLSGGAPQAQSVEGARISPDFFKVFRVQPALGRGFRAEEEQDGQGQVAILSDGLWKQRYAGDPNILGKSVRIDGVEYRIVGVMSPRFQVALIGAINVWMPLALGPQERQNRTDRNLGVFARLQPQVTPEAARAYLDRFAQHLEERAGASHTNLGFRLLTYSRAVARQSGENGMRVVFGIVGCLLLIACSNVANLILARSLNRRREMGIRLAMGAGRWRLARQVVTESVLLFLAGGLASILVAQWIAQGSENRLPPSVSAYLPNYGRVELNYVAFVYTLAVAFITGVMFSVGPALRASGVDLNEVLKQTSRNASHRHAGRWQDALVIVEIAMTLIITVTAGLLCRNLIAVYAADPGFQSKDVYLGRLSLPEKRYSGDERVRQFYDSLLSRARAKPEISAAALAEFPPFGGIGDVQFEITGKPSKPGERPLAGYSAISAGYIQLLHLHLLEGRDIQDSDRENRMPVAIVNRTFARRFFPKSETVGQTLQLMTGKPQTVQIVGVVEDAIQFELGETPKSVVLTSCAQFPSHLMQLLVRSQLHKGSSAANAMLQSVFAEDRDLALSRVASLDTLMAEQMAPQRLLTQWTIGFAGLAVLLSMTGIYGVVSYTVERQTQEFGIRIALGAQPDDILRQVTARSLYLLVPGVTIGLAGIFASSYVLRAVLVKVSPTDPLSLTGVTLLFVSLALFACAIPARRASKIQPIEALRYE